MSEGTFSDTAHHIFGRKSLPYIYIVYDVINLFLEYLFG